MMSMLHATNKLGKSRRQPLDTHCDSPCVSHLFLSLWIPSQDVESGDRETGMRRVSSPQVSRYAVRTPVQSSWRGRNHGY